MGALAGVSIRTRNVPASSGDLSRLGVFSSGLEEASPPAGSVNMVDVGDKAVTTRTASASGAVFMATETLALIRAGDAKKGDVIGGGVVKVFVTNDNQKKSQKTFDSSKVGINNETEKFQEVYTR